MPAEPPTDLPAAPPDADPAAGAAQALMPVARLQQMPLFGGLSADALDHLLQQAGVVAVAAGQPFFREGDAADSMFVLARGRAEVRKGWQGREVPLRTLEEGDCFGEMALMDLQPRSATVLALDDCRALVFGPAHLLRLYEHDVAQFALLQMNLGREVCRRLRATDERAFRLAMGAPAD